MINIQKNHIERKPVRDFYPIGILGLLLFIPLFMFRRIIFLDFWWWMSLNLVLLVSLALMRDRSFRKELVADRFLQPGKKIILGLVSAAILYLVFFAGNMLIREFFDFAGKDIQAVYGFKEGAPSWRIALLMILFIGPGEELFWRGFIQGNLTRLLGNRMGLVLAVMYYSIIHIATGNVVLIVAALTGGLFWGWLYLRYKSMLINIVSHLVWDVMVFLIFPFVA